MFDISIMNAIIKASAYSRPKVGEGLLLFEQPVIPLQQESAECGLIAACALSWMYGFKVSVTALRGLVGSTSRGLTVKHVRDLLRLIGFGAQVTKWDSVKILSSPEPCVVLLKEGHYVVLGRLTGKRRYVFDPGSGWYEAPIGKLVDAIQPYYIEIRSLPQELSLPRQPDFPWRDWFELITTSKAALLITGSVLAANVFPLVLPYLGGRIFDFSPNGTADSRKFNEVLLYLGFGILSVMFGLVVQDVRGRFFNKLSRTVVADATKRVFEAHVSDFHSISGRHFFGIINAADSLAKDIARNFSETAVSAFIGLLAGAVVFAYSPLLATCGMAALTFRWIVNKVTLHKTAGLAEAMSARQLNYFSMLHEKIRALPIIRVAKGEDAAVSALTDLHSKAKDEELKLESYQARLSSLFRVSDVVDRCAFLALSAWLVQEGKISTGEVLSVSMYREMLVTGSNSLVDLFGRFRGMQLSSIKLADLYSQAKQPDPLLIELDRSSPDRGRVQFDHVSISYNLLDEPTISDVSFDVLTGENVAFVGPSGSGKSSVVKAICGLVRPSKGSISIGGVVANDQSMFALLRRIGVVMQDDRLISGSIAENISMQSTSDESALHAAAKIAEIHEVIMSLPMGYRTIVSDESPGLSGGQRQRILLARALYNKPHILILDEATSALDATTEMMIIKNIRSLGITRLQFAHSERTIASADRVISIAGGINHKSVYQSA